MQFESVPTRGRTLDMAAGVYDIFEPMLLLGKQQEINQTLISLLDPAPEHRILDVGCGTGVVTQQISTRLCAEAGGRIIGIDAAGKMVSAAMARRHSPVCSFEAAAAEDLPFEDQSFDAVVSSFFYHHIQLDLKRDAFSEAFRVLRPGGRLIVADMHTPTSFFGALTSHISRWILFQPQIAENIRGMLPGIIEAAGFTPPKIEKEFLGYVAVFSSRKP